MSKELSLPPNLKSFSISTYDYHVSAETSGDDNPVYKIEIDRSMPGSDDKDNFIQISIRGTDIHADVINDAIVKDVIELVKSKII